MDLVGMGRTLMSESLAFHILIVALSIGLPVLMSIFEYFAWRRGETETRSLVKLLAAWSAIFAIGGVMSGTIIALQFSTLWAPYLDASRPYVGQFFQLEGYMFLIEAAFLSWYLFTIKQVGTLKHFLIGLPISFGTIGSAFFITAVNAWMNNPSAIFTSTTFSEVVHSVLSYLFSTTLLVLGYVAWHSRRSSPKARRFSVLTTKRLGWTAAIFLVVLGFMGHQSAVDIGNSQPHKLAAIEILDKTSTNAPLRIGGHMTSDGRAEGGIVIPGALSLLAGMSFNHEVKGLDAIPREKWPMLVVHTLFDIKMALVGLSTIIVAAVLWWSHRNRQLPGWLRHTVVWTSGIGLTMIELGWMITEFGRQPYTIYGSLLTRDAYTKGIDITSSAIIFPVLFLLLITTTISALVYATRLWRQKERPSW